MSRWGAGLAFVAMVACTPEHVTGAQMESTIKDALDEVLAGRTDTSVAIERAQQAKHRLLDAGGAAVGAIEARLTSGSFEEKRRCYALLIEMGDRAVERLQQRLNGQPPAVVLWETGVLHTLNKPFDRAPLFALLQHPAPYWRHLSALAIAFQRLADPVEMQRVIPVLIDGLSSNEFIEGSKFTVAGGSLASLNGIAGKSFAPDGRPVEIYNLTWAFPPPVVPFPLASVALDGPSRARMIQDVESWWASRKP